MVYNVFIFKIKPHPKKDLNEIETKHMTKLVLSNIMSKEF